MHLNCFISTSGGSRSLLITLELLTSKGKQFDKVGNDITSKFNVSLNKTKFQSLNTHGECTYMQTTQTKLVSHKNAASVLHIL